MWILIGALILLLFLAVGAFFILRRLGGRKFPWVQFYIRGKESGFSFKEINLLRRIAVEGQMQNPTSLFWSVKQLDRSIRSLILKYRSLGQENEEKSVSMVAKLLAFRKKVELSQPKYKIGIKSTRQIVQHQRLRIMLPGAGPFFSTVVENLRRYMAFSYPQGPKVPPGFSWKGRKIGVYFFRQADAGYYFQTKVANDFIDKKYPILHVAHADNLIRTQKRRSVRVDCNLPAMLYPLRTLNEGNESPEAAVGLRSRIIDVSEDGAAILIGGKAKVGIIIKVQFLLGDSSIVLSGVVKNINFDPKKNRSILHLQAQPLSLIMQNRVLEYVYNIFGERETPSSFTPENPDAASPLPG
ncbi:MAG: PilZ domain-containing protein [Spirochaetales bacterium]|nr:PilZ domain-containing protein [Spirochaetales bacterium]